MHRAKNSTLCHYLVRKVVVIGKIQFVDVIKVVLKRRSWLLLLLSRQQVAVVQFSVQIEHFVGRLKNVLARVIILN